ncbi:TPA: type II secretion system protein N [Enterobacter cancerogenus]
MATISLLAKNALSYRPLHVMIILICAMGIFINIHSAYIQWGNNRALLVSQDIPPPLHNINEKYRWNLSTSAHNRMDKAALPSESMDILSRIHLSGIIHSSDKLSSRAILQEDGEQNIYSINDLLKSSPSTRITDITRNQVFFSAGGQTGQLTLLAELTLPTAPQDVAHDRLAPARATLSNFIETTSAFDRNELRGLRH